MPFETLADALKTQRRFSNLFFNPSDLSEKEMEEITKTFILSLHAEASELITAVNYKDHRLVSSDVDKTKILFKTVDIFRYTLAMLNLWGIDAEQFVQACEVKDTFLHTRHQIETQIWSGQPVVIFDMDDVIAEFREAFNNWLASEKGMKINPNSTEYYNTVGVRSAGLEPEAVFREFIDSGGFRAIPLNSDVAATMSQLKEEGYWVQILTARPADNLRCYYDTFAWVQACGLEFNSISFSGEKFRWLADQPFYNYGAVVCAIDDSPKHAAELAKHGIPVIVPVLPYNQELIGFDNIHRVDFKSIDLIELVKEIQDGE
jgi:phosphoserine phosphatase